MRELAILISARRRASVLALSLPAESSPAARDEIVRRIRPFVRVDDFICLLEDGDLAVILRDVGDKANAIGAAQRLFERCELLQRFTAGRGGLLVAFGIVMLPSEQNDAASVWRRAQLAARYACRTQARWVCWSDGQENVEAAVLSREDTLAGEILQGLDRGEFELHYQPQLGMRDSGLRGVEALARWRRADRVVMPNEFIPVVETAGLSAAFGSWVLGEACRQTAAWQAEGLHVPRMAVNVSARQLRGDLVDIVSHMLAIHRLEPDRLEIELTESAEMSDPDEAIAVTEKLARLGISFSLDDFGTGYSSFIRLKSGPFQAVKIERQFVASMLTDTFDREMLRAIIHFGQRVGLQTIAEGVETQEQLRALRDMGCQAWQGYLCSRPLPAVEAGAFLRQLPRY